MLYANKNILNVNYDVDMSLQAASIKPSTDEKIARYDGTGDIQGSSVTLKDNGNMLDLNAISFTATSDQSLTNQLRANTSNLLSYNNEDVVIQSGLATIGNLPMYNTINGKIEDSGFNIASLPVIDTFEDTFSFFINGAGTELFTTIHFLKIGQICTAVIKGIIYDFTSDNAFYLQCSAIPVAYRPTYTSDATISTIKSTTLANPALNTESDVSGLIRVLSNGEMYIYKQPPINDNPDYSFQWTEQNAGFHTCSISYIIVV